MSEQGYWVQSKRFIPLTRKLLEQTQDFSKRHRPETLASIVNTAMELIEHGWELEVS